MAWATVRSPTVIYRHVLQCCFFVISIAEAVAITLMHQDFTSTTMFLFPNLIEGWEPQTKLIIGCKKCDSYVEYM